MKFYICSTCLNRDTEHLLREYPCLVDFGYSEEVFKEDGLSRIKDENGKFIMQIVKNDHIVTKPYIILDTLEDLVRFKNACRTELVFKHSFSPDYCEIEIYDGYRE